MTDTPIPPPVPGVPTVIPRNGIQYNLDGAGAPYEFDMPAGVDMANPTGVRNINDLPMSIVFNAAAGESFWVPRTASYESTITKIVEPGQSAMYVFYPAFDSWVPYLAPTVTISEAWQATPITGIGVPSVVQWTFAPLFTGQVPTFFTEAAGVFTYAQTFLADVNVGLSAGMAFVSAGNNTDATFTLDFADVVVVNPSLFIPIRNSFQTTRSGNFPVSGNSSGLVPSVTTGDTFRVTANLDSNTGLMSVDLDSALLVFTMS